MTVSEDDKVVIFFDIDNTLYSKKAKVHELMQVYIHRFFVTHLDLDDESAENLHQHYYKDFGLAIEGLVRFNQVDALEYNKEVDDALPLQDILKPDQKLRELLLSIDKTKVEKLWLFTNAYKNHGRRVVRLLGIDDLFEGITFCDYAHPPLLCKPKTEMYEKVIRDAGVRDKSKIVYIDDSALNIKASKKLGWGTNIHYAEEGSEGVPNNTGESSVGDYTISSLYDLPQVLPHLFKKPDCQ